MEGKNIAEVDQSEKPVQLRFLPRMPFRGHERSRGGVSSQQSIRSYSPAVFD